MLELNLLAAKQIEKCEKMMATRVRDREREYLRLSSKRVKGSRRVQNQHGSVCELLAALYDVLYRLLFESVFYGEFFLWRTLWFMGSFGSEWDLQQLSRFGFFFFSSFRLICGVLGSFALSLRFI